MSQTVAESLAQDRSPETPRGIRSFISPAILLIALATYAGVAFPLISHFLESGSGDVICYVQRARYLAAGDFYHSISGYWSPLLSWCIAPFIAGGMDGLVAARVVHGIWGGILLISIWGLLHTLRCPGAWITIILIVAAPWAAIFAAGHVTPDLVMAACLMFYLSAVSREDWLDRRRTQWLAGLLGGLSYIGKAYALPFVVAHLLLTTIIRAAARRGALRASLSAWMFSMLGLALTAGPWIGVLSWRYSSFTISTSASRAHAIVGPQTQRGMPDFAVLPDPYVVPWENPEDIPHPFWSPLASRANFFHQLHVIGQNSRRILASFGDLAAFHVIFTVICVSPLLEMFRMQRPGRRSLTLWLAVTVLLFAGGFLPVYFTSRYIEPFVMGVSVALCAMLAMEIRGPALVRQTLALALVACFAYSAVARLREAFAEPVTGVYREVARAIARQNIEGAIASPDFRKSYQLALRTGKKCVGFPTDENLDLVDARLRQANATILVLWGRDPRRQSDLATVRANQFLNHTPWKRIYQRKAGGVEIYVRPSGQASRTASGSVHAADTR